MRQKHRCFAVMVQEVHQHLMIVQIIKTSSVKQVMHPQIEPPEQFQCLHLMLLKIQLRSGMGARATELNISAAFDTKHNQGGVKTGGGRYTLWVESYGRE